MSQYCPCRCPSAEDTHGEMRENPRLFQERADDLLHDEPSLEFGQYFHQHSGANNLDIKRGYLENGDQPLPHPLPRHKNNTNCTLCNRSRKPLYCNSEGSPE